MAKTVVRKLPGVLFGNAALPIIPELTIVALNEIMAAYRFYGTDYLLDLSGRGRTLQATGAPVVAGGKAVLANANLFTVPFTNVGRTALTIAGIFGVAATPNNTLPLIGDYNLVSATPTQSTGGLIYIKSNGAPGMNVYYTDTAGAVAGATLSADIASPSIGTQMTFMAMRLSSTGLIQLDIPRLSYRYSKQLASFAGYTWGDRGARIGRVYDGNFTTATDRYASEALIWPRDLTDAELSRQYTMSNALAVARGIGSV